jgi:nucleoid-associated protein Lsr2
VARSITRQRVDDIDGSPAQHTVSFALDGQRLQIDLNDAHAARLRDLFVPYISAGRTAGPRRSATVKSGAAATTGVQRSRRRGAGNSARVSTTVGTQTAERRSLPQADASSSGPQPRRAAVVQLKRRSQVPTGPFDVARHRHRLVAEMGELTRVVAVALLAAAADRLVGVIVKPAITAANGENVGRRIRGDTPDITASIVPGTPSSSSAAPAG